MEQEKLFWVDEGSQLWRVRQLFIAAVGQFGYSVSLLDGLSGSVEKPWREELEKLEASCQQEFARSPRDIANDGFMNLLEMVARVSAIFETVSRVNLEFIRRMDRIWRERPSDMDHYTVCNVMAIVAARQACIDAFRVVEGLAKLLKGKFEQQASVN